MKAFSRLYLFLLFGALLTLASCDKLDEATQKDITVSNIEIPITTQILQPGKLQSGIHADFFPFSGSTTININNSQFSDLKNNQEYIKSFKVDEVVIKSSTSGNGTLVQNLVTTSTATGLAASFTVLEYHFGDEYSNPDLITYSQSIMQALFDNKDIVLTANGQTDETSANNITHTIVIKKATLTVKLKY